MSYLVADVVFWDTDAQLFYVHIAKSDRNKTLFACIYGKTELEAKNNATILSNILNDPGHDH